MKTIMMLLLLCSVAIAGNPDERTSVTILAGGNYLGGELSIFDDFGSSVSQDIGQRDFFIGTEIINPQNDNMSVVFKFNYVQAKGTADTTPILFEQENKLTGISVSIGLKFYLSK